ncbi:MAG: class I SAM-dependent methyltransferase [Bacteroidetes bacterium]|nr:class I SAM-dependent methyltransferase [Bacteroidota bacterium]
MKLINIIKRSLPIEKRLKLLYIYRSILGRFNMFNLNRLALIHKTDKYGIHNYTPHYHSHFKHLRLKKIQLLEIGVGGYENPLIGGNSLRMWKSYFPFAKIISLDIFNKAFLQERRIKIYQGSQIDELFLNSLIQNEGEFDIVIDDGSHINEHVIKTFEIIFPKLKNGGIYVVEDTQTSYWEGFGGSSYEFNKTGTIYSFFKSLIDSMNSEEFIIKDYNKSFYDKHIVSMHFYHNMIFVYKGINNERSNKKMIYSES